VDAVTAETSYHETYAHGRWVIVVASATNTGSAADDTFHIVDLVDVSGRRYEAVTSDVFPDYFDLADYLDVAGHVEDIAPGDTAQVLWVYDVPVSSGPLRLASSYSSCRS
jgi:hypothetical protein